MKRIFITVIAVLVMVSCANAQPYKGAITAKHHRHLVAQVTQAPQPVVASATDNACRPGAWRSVTPTELEQATDLVRQYRETSAQITRLQAGGPSSVAVMRPEKTGWFTPKAIVYEGPWDEVRDALQAMLNKRLASLACKLQTLGVSMEPPKNS